MSAFDIENEHLIGTLLVLRIPTCPTLSISVKPFGLNIAFEGLLEREQLKFPIQKLVTTAQGFLDDISVKGDNAILFFMDIKAVPNKPPAMAPSR